MQTTMPVTQTTHTLEATAVLKATGDKVSQGAPLQGVDVKVYDTDPVAAATAPLDGITNSSGIVLLKITVPVIGKAFDVTAQYVNMVQRVPSVLLCADTIIHFVFDTSTPPLIDCATLNASDTLIFVNERGDTSLTQNMPSGTGKYERCWSITNPVGASGAVSITLASVASPFTIAAAYIDAKNISTTGTVSLAAGQTLSICFDVATKDTGIFLQTISLPVKCPSSQGVISLTLRAHVIQPPCECSAQDITLTHSDRVHVGDSVNYSDQVFTNQLSCPVVVDSISFNGLDGSKAWMVLSPKFPVTLQPGAQLTITTRFAARGAGATQDTLVLRVTPLNGTPCAMNVILQGNGCGDVCPNILRNGSQILFGSKGVFSDTLFNPVDPSSNRIQVSILSVTPQIVNIVDTTYQIALPDSACAAENVIVEETFSDTTSQRFFNSTPASIILQPGVPQNISVQFTAPDIADFRAIVARRQAVGAPHPVTADSAFTVIIKLRTANGCYQEIHVTAVLTTYPELSPVIDLIAYSQRTPFVPDPDDEVYTFGNAAYTTLRTVQGNGPFPPNAGDIYINVADTTAAGVPPQPPILYLRANKFSGMKLWKSGYAEASFDNVAFVVQQFFATPGYNTGYSSNPISPLTPGDVYAFQYNNGAGTYALMYIRAVLNGTENNTNKQSAIEFRTIYPVVQP